MMKEIIATLGVVVEIACNGDEGCKAIVAEPDAFGLVLMDLHMPGMSGIEATRTIRHMKTNPPADIPIIAVTADVNYHDDARVEQLGMNGYASKPVSPGHLMNLIDQYCVAA